MLLGQTRERCTFERFASLLGRASLVFVVQGGDSPRRVEEFASPLNKRGLVFTPSGDTAFFALRSGDGYISAICVAVRRRGRWREPEVLPFSGRYYDTDVALSADGRTLYFATNRPASGEGPAKRDLDIWVVDRNARGWGVPRRLMAPVSSDADDAAPSPARDGSLLFTSTRAGGRGSYDLYVARRTGDSTYDATNLGAPINTAAAELWPALSPDGSTLVFVAIARPDEILGPGNAYPRGDLYVSTHTPAGWSEPRHLPAPINSAAAECCVTFSRDGARVYFTSERGAMTNGAPRTLSRRDMDSVLAGADNGAGNPYVIPAAALRSAAAAASDSGWRAPTDSAARIIGEGTISTAANEFSGSLSPDGRELYFSRSVPRSYFYAILVSRFEHGAWTTPEIAPFSGRWRDFDAAFYPGGRRLYFVSDRPIDGLRPTVYHFWYVDRRGDGSWGEPQLAPAPLNGKASSWTISFAADSTAYFASQGDEPSGPGTLYRSRLVNGAYGVSERLPPEVNFPNAFMTEPYVSSDQRFLLYSASFGGVDGYDVYVSYNVNGKWAQGERLNALVNTDTRDYSARLTPDERAIVFTSERHFATGGVARPVTYAELVAHANSILNGHGNIYSVPLHAAGVR